MCFSFQPHLVCSLLMKTPFSSMFYHPKCFPLCSRQTFLSDTFYLFLLLAPALFFLPQFFLPMARSHATFTPSSLLLSHSLLHLLLSLFFSAFQLASLKSPSLFLSSVCSSNSASFILPCCTYCSLLSFLSFPSFPTVPCLCPRAVSGNGEGGKQLHHMLL